MHSDDRSDDLRALSEIARHRGGVGRPCEVYGQNGQVHPEVSLSRKTLCGESRPHRGRGHPLFSLGEGSSRGGGYGVHPDRREGGARGDRAVHRERGQEHHHPRRRPRGERRRGEEDPRADQGADPRSGGPRRRPELRGDREHDTTDGPLPDRLLRTRRPPRGKDRTHLAERRFDRGLRLPGGGARDRVQLRHLDGKRDGSGRQRICPLSPRGTNTPTPSRSSSRRSATSRCSGRSPSRH